MPEKTGNFKSEDHDTLIRVETKLDQLFSEVKDIKDGTTAKLADHELRINTLEAIVTEVKPIETFKDFQNLKSKVHDAFVVANAWRWVAGIIGAGVMWVITQIPNIIKAWGIK